jgi:hypothetical protein
MLLALSERRLAMTADKKERWQELCEQAAKEQDGEKLSQLVAEIDRILQEEQDRIEQELRISRHEPKPPEGPPTTD